MPLKLMYITNRPSVAQIAESSGVDRIFVDLEYIGKEERQGHLDTVKSQHTLDDVKRISDAITTAQLLVRINPIHEATDNFISSKDEIDTAIANGADILMLPFFKTVKEVEQFVSFIDGRVKTMLLIETPEAVEQIDSILSVEGIDFVHIGLNDLSLGYGMKFMFQLLSDGTVEKICKKCSEKGISYGFGGISSLGTGMVPAEMIIKEHYRLGSSCAILSRSFCNVDKSEHMGVISSTFVVGMKAIRELEAECEAQLVASNMEYFNENKTVVEKSIEDVVQQIG